MTELRLKDRRVDTTMNANGRNAAGFALRAATVCALVLVSVGCQEDKQNSTTGNAHNVEPVASSDSRIVESADVDITQEVKVFCGACHAVPVPDSFPKDAWYDEVKRGFNFYFDSGRKDLTPPRQASVVSWYQQRAPEQLAEPEQTDSLSSPLEFKFRTIDVPINSTEAAAVSVVRPGDAKLPSSRVWVSDMRRGVVIDCDINDPGNANVINIGSNPAGTCDVDLDQNGITDLVVADLGSFLPEDHTQGQVLWLPDVGSNSPAPRIILDSIGRVADVQPADLDNDGDQDLVVAEFGWHKTGGIHAVFNEIDNAGQRTFRDLRLDSRPGTIHVPVTDLDGDGRQDFVALISQEHEVIEAFLNRETGFEKIRLYAAPDPSYGSSGIQLNDIDGDGDSDILYSVGDTFDSYLIKPYHGIWLLRNDGQMHFEVQHIAAMPGVLRAVLSDLDGDGDQDIVAAALLPEKSLRGKTESDLQALIWLEQTADGQFIRHVIQRGLPIYGSLAVRDFDGDSDPDIVTGCFHAETANPASLLHVFENLRPGK
jgi:hypothetical protein